MIENRPSVGADRDWYAREVEPRPSRFREPAAYAAWAGRADAWAVSIRLSSLPKAEAMTTRKQRAVYRSKGRFQNRYYIALLRALWAGQPVPIRGSSATPKED